MIGIVHGDTIQLIDAPPLDEGARFEVVLRPLDPVVAAGAGLIRTEGVLTDDDEWDAIMESVQQFRRTERPAAELPE